MSRRFIKGILGLLVSTLIGSHLFADIVSINPRPRAQSMGGAGLATLGDKDSAIMNPAGLADVEKRTVQAFPLLIEVPFDIGLTTSTLDFNDIREDDTKTREEKQKALRDLLGDAATTATALRVNLYPSYTQKYMHIGLLFDAYVDPRVRAGGATSNQVIEFGGSNVTTGFYVGGGYGFLEDKLQVGATLKPLYRLSVIKNNDFRLYDVTKGTESGTDMTDEIFGKDILNQRGYALGVDLGVKYFIPYFEEFKPMVGATYQDIGNTRFVSDHKLPADVDQSLSLGAAIHPTLWILKTAFALDFRNVTSESHFLNKLHIGAEAVIWDLLAFRVGLNQAYVTGGFGLITKLFEMDLYVTSREAGEFAHIQDITTLGVRLASTF